MKVSLLIDLLTEMPEDADVFLEHRGFYQLLADVCEEPELGVVLLFEGGDDD